MPAIGFGDACWHCWVVASTVGYGLVASDVPGTNLARAWASVHILLGVTLFATTVGHFMSLHGSRTARMKSAQLKSGKLDQELIAKLDRDGGNGVDRMEYVVGMLTQIGVVNWSDVQPFLDQFDRFDSDGSGHLDRADIERVVASSTEAAADAVGRRIAPPTVRTKFKRHASRYSVSPG